MGEATPKLRIEMTAGQHISCVPGKVMPIPEEGPFTAIQPHGWSLMESHLLRLRLAWLVEGLTGPGGPPNPAWETRALLVGPRVGRSEGPVNAPQAGGQVATWIGQQVTKGRLTPAEATAAWARWTRQKAAGEDSEYTLAWPKNGLPAGERTASREPDGPQESRPPSTFYEHLKQTRPVRLFLSLSQRRLQGLVANV